MLLRVGFIHGRQNQLSNFSRAPADAEGDQQRKPDIKSQHPAPVIHRSPSSDCGDIHRLQVLASPLLPGGEQGPGGVDGGDTAHRVLHRSPADTEAVAVLPAALGGSVDHQIDGARGDHIHNIRMGLRHPGHPGAGHSRVQQRLPGAVGGQNLNAHFGKTPGDADALTFVLVLYGDDHPSAPLGRAHIGPLEGL